MDYRTAIGKWLLPPPADRAEARVFCLPWAGGGAAAERAWLGSLALPIEACFVQLPGRENRLNEPAIRELDALIPPLARALLPALDRPFALFGHSAGALVAFELARFLRRKNWPKPSHLFVSAKEAPPIAPTLPAVLGQLDDDHLLARVGSSFQGLPAGGDPDGWRYILPALRADIALAEAYVYRDEAPLDIPITVFGGWADTNTPKHYLRAWQAQTSAEFSLQMLDGGHFYREDSRRQMVRTISTAFKN